jgi:ferredoxin-NADP reductase
VPRAVPWLVATLAERRVESPRAVSLHFDVEGWTGHRAGQHVDVRLTAEDGYQAERSYSIASAPGADRVQLTVERIPDGEVSPYLADVLEPGDAIELRGPIGGYFVWEATSATPLLLVGGGSGVVPLVAMLRHRAASGSRVPARLLYSSRSADDLLFRSELETLAAGDGQLALAITLTREQPPGWTGYARRIDAALLAEVHAPLGPAVDAYVCGPTAFVETAAEALVASGVAPPAIRTERFGPTGS